MIKMEREKISKKQLMRLPVYLNYIKSLPENTRFISATQIANALGLGDVLVRKDLAKISNGGRRKVGYPCAKLLKDIEDFMSINNSDNAIVIGAGRMGQTLLDFNDFYNSGLNILAGFDIDPEKQRTQYGKPIYSMSELESYIKVNHITIGIIAVPADSAQAVCDQLVSFGIKAIWNFAHAHLNVPEHVAIQTENFNVSLAALRMQLKK